jgi:hypothetical protein
MPRWIRFGPRSLFLGLIPLMVFFTPEVRADLGSETYTAPLVGKFAICRVDLNLPNAALGSYQLVEVTGTNSCVFVITCVEKVAVSNSVIVGKSDKGYFILDTAAANPVPQQFQSLESWQTALVAIGIPKNVAVVAPDVIAAGLPNRSIRPWAYRLMGGTFGLSDEGWAGVVVLAGLALAFVAGLRQSRGSLLLVSVGIGLPLMKEFGSVAAILVVSPPRSRAKSAARHRAGVSPRADRSANLTSSLTATPSATTFV